MEVKDLLINENITVMEALELLDKIAKKVLFVQKEGKLLAALTDGDIRRWILAHGSMSEPIKAVANYSPIYLYEYQMKDARAFMKEKSIEALPILNSENEIVTILMWDDKDILKENRTINVPVIMMAGGKGTRLYPYTRILPKPLIPIGNLPIAEVIINKFRSFGCRNFYLIVNYKQNMIKAYFNESSHDYNLYYVEELEPLGTAGGLSLMKGRIDETFILTNCDILIRDDFAKIMDYHKKNSNLITMICSIKNITIPYGIVELGKEGEISSMREKPKLSFLVNTGCYVVEPQIIQELPENLNIGFPEIIEKYHKDGKRVGIYPISENSWLDMGQFDELQRMKRELGE